MKKEEFIRIRVAGWQKKYISLQAEKAHKSLSQYVRDAAMDKDVTVIDGVDDPIREAVEWYTQHQLYLAEATAERQRVQRKLSAQAAEPPCSPL